MSAHPHRLTSVSEGQIEQYDNSDRESLKNILKQFTGTDVWLIIKEEFGDRMTELMQLSGSVIKEESKKRNGLQQEIVKKVLGIWYYRLRVRINMR